MSGGHDYAGNSTSDGGLLLDLSRMCSVSVDPDARRVRVGPGARWGAVDAATQAHGLVAVGGTVSIVGVAGFTLGGGQGWLTRKHGLACDNLVEAEVVTADGEIVRASERENPDLFWGLRGGGGNLGVVTSFEFRLHDLEHHVLAGQIVYPFDRAAEALRLYRDYFATAPDEMTVFPFFYRVPPVDGFPEATHGEVVIAFVIGYVGDPSEGKRAVAPFGQLGDPILSAVSPCPYVDLQQSFDAGMGPGHRWYTRSHDFDEVSDACIDALVASLDPFLGPYTAVYLGPGGGAVARLADDATAYPNRGSAHYVHVLAGWDDPAEDGEVMTWARGVADAVAPFANGSVYVNLLGEDEGERVPDAYGANYGRLAELKARWDPENVFRNNHNVEPAL